MKEMWAILGTILSVIISYDRYHDVLWAILHGLCGWIYVIYWLIFLYWMG